MGGNATLSNCNITLVLFVLLYHNIHITKLLKLSEFITSDEFGTIARALRSASHNALPNGDSTFLEIQGSRLVERVYDGEELKDMRIVATGLRQDSAAAYALARDRIYAVYISDDGIIKASEFDEDSEEWDDAELEGLGDMPVHGESHIAVAALPSMDLVLYRAPGGGITTVKHEKESGMWTEGFDIPGSAATGTPIAEFSTDDALVVCFFGEDNELHAHSRDFETGDWTEELVPDSFFEDTASIIVGKDKDNGNFEVYVLSNNTVYNITKTGSRHIVGNFNRDEDFEPSKSGDYYSNNWDNNWSNYRGSFTCYRGCTCGCGQGVSCGCFSCGCGCTRPSQNPQW